MFYDFKAGTRAKLIPNKYYIINGEMLKFLREVESDSKLLFYDINSNYKVIYPYKENIRIKYIGDRHDVIKKYPQYMI